MHEWIENYLNHLVNKDVSKNTIKSYTNDLKQFQRYITDEFNINVTEVQEEHIENYQRWMKDTKRWTAKTRARKTTVIKEFYKWASKKYKIENPASDIELPVLEKRLPVYLSIEEVQKLINATQTQPEPYRSRDKLMLLLFITTGLRLSELANIKLTDITDDVLTVIGKGNKQRQVALNKDVKKALVEYLKVRNSQSEYLFVSNRDKQMSIRTIQYTVEKYLNLAGLDTSKYSTHKLRHTAATLMLQGNLDIRIIQEVLGHKSIQTTQIYTHIDKKQLKKAASVTEGLFS